MVSLFLEGAALPWVPSGPITYTIGGIGQGPGPVSGHGPQSIGGPIWDSGFGSQTLAPALIGLTGHAIPLNSASSMPMPQNLIFLSGNAATILKHEPLEYSI